jgi:YebC/PmpR family DNA-binding regulatory protein
VSGHSRWANIKRDKNVSDAARGKLFSKLIKEVTVAAKLGGPDPDANPRLRAACDKARANSTPRDTIERAIAKGSGNIDVSTFEQLTYEGYGHGGVAILVACLTDNRARTAADVRNAFTKAGGNMGTAGSVSYLFQTKGLFRLSKEGIDEDTVTMAALEGGAEDVTSEGDDWSVVCAFESYAACRRALEDLGVDVRAELSQVPDTLVAISSEHAAKLMKLIDRIEDLDDVQETFTNAELDESLA